MAHERVVVGDQHGCATLHAKGPSAVAGEG
jgi:hypothetical protein